MSSGLKTILLILVLPITVWAQGMGRSIESPPANVRPPGLKHVGIEQHLNDQIPPQLIFRDETGKTVHLGDYFGKQPMILNLVYYKCPMLCSEVLSGLTSALKPMKFDIGKDFDVLTISFDPRETPQDATESKATWLKRYGRPDAEKGWHFLTGPQESIDALTNAAGFQYDYNEKSGQFAHATAILVLTPEGKIAQYYYGVEFSPKDLRLAMVQASQNKIGSLVDQMLLYCYHYDPSVGRYSVLVLRVLRLAGVATMLLLGGFMLMMFRHDAAQRRSGTERTH
ncbi:MAG TPA: SCO family protein [Terriglobales bacterium]|nr:SCO family protein [Terriglobales bacterium]